MTILSPLAFPYNNDNADASIEQNDYPMSGNYYIVCVYPQSNSASTKFY